MSAQARRLHVNDAAFLRGTTRASLYVIADADVIACAIATTTAIGIAIRSQKSAPSDSKPAHVSPQ
ncbi:hypothetical protein CAP48_03230 [Advenella sp. S44]|nr:hypothetical protein CAP48_03230 [Advenella sp. S44]